MCAYLLAYNGPLDLMNYDPFFKKKKQQLTNKTENSELLNAKGPQLD